MADEEPIKRTDDATGEKGEGGGSKKKLILLIAVFILTFVLAGVGNFIQLQMTYVPPEPPPPEEQAQETHEEKGPILSIDLNDEPEEPLLEATVTGDSLAQTVEDSASLQDSVEMVILELRSNLKHSDSLLAVTIKELEEVKKQLKRQNAQEDSANLKRTAKLAKIVESMPPKEAAEMLEPLSDEMILDILLRLKQRQAAKIMAEFSTKRSAKLSEVILKPLVQG
jgi:flagellar motility protein MotE (MotC chaperone)